ncbi:MAG: dihydroorotate dehydrogenase electron transfer subunit [Mariprofundaceae bacterium]
MPEATKYSVFETRAEILAHAHHDGDQHILRLHAPEVSRAAAPGQFVHLRVSDCRPLRRPISIMLTDPERGTLDLLYKVVGAGTRELSERRPGEHLPMLGPIGRGFDLADPAKRYVMIGGGVGIPPMIFCADRLAGRADGVLFAGSEVPFPFALKPALDLLPGIGGEAILTIASLEARGVPCRLASNAGLYGCFSGHVPDLAAAYLEALPEAERARVVILACGPHPMLAAVARLANRLGLPAQLSLEEYMACGIGGCAGCVVRTQEKDGAHYRRVCVDGPVFPAGILPEFV